MKNLLTLCLLLAPSMQSIIDDFPYDEVLPVSDMLREL
jgi:hypothetical protein